MIRSTGENSISVNVPYDTEVDAKVRVNTPKKERRAQLRLDIEYDQEDATKVAALIGAARAIFKEL